MTANPQFHNFITKDYCNFSDVEGCDNYKLLDGRGRNVNQGMPDARPDHGEIFVPFLYF